MRAATKGHTKIVRLLLDKGADVNAKDNSGNTALMLADREGHTDIAKLLQAARRLEVQKLVKQRIAREEARKAAEAEAEEARKAAAAEAEAEAEAAAKYAAAEAEAAAREAAAEAANYAAAAAEARAAAREAAEARAAAREAAAEARAAKYAASEAAREAEAEAEASKTWARLRQKLNIEYASRAELEIMMILMQEANEKLSARKRKAKALAKEAAEAVREAAEAVREAEEAKARAEREAKEAEAAKARREAARAEAEAAKARGEKRRQRAEAEARQIAEAEARQRAAAEARQRAAAEARQRAAAEARKAATLARKELQAFNARAASYGTNVEQMLREEGFKIKKYNARDHPVYGRRIKNYKNEWMTQVITIPSTPSNKKRFFDNTKIKIKAAIEHLFLNKEDYEKQDYIVYGNEVRSKWEELEEPGQGAL